MKQCILVLLASCLGLGSAMGQETSRHAISGRVVILDNEKTLTGDVVRQGEQYAIKRLIGETVIPADRVLKVCASLEEAYQFLARRANLQDPDERVRLAEWCREHGLTEQALAEVREAAALRPENEKIRRLMRHLEATKTSVRSPEKTVSKQEFPRVEVSAESMGMFASKIQPILSNACASCHVSGRAPGFPLMRVVEEGMASRTSLEKNLSVVLAQVNPEQPLASKLLLKAASVHAPGMAQAPLKGRNSPAYRLLEQWVKMTIETNPHLAQMPRPATTQKSPSPSEHAAVKTGFGEERLPPTAPRTMPPVSLPPAPVSPMPTPPTIPSATTRPPPTVDDIGDPQGYNREFHPERSKADREKEKEKSETMPPK
jgi:hypothetical protein